MLSAWLIAAMVAAAGISGGPTARRCDVFWFQVQRLVVSQEAEDTTRSAPVFYLADFEQAEVHGADLRRAIEQLPRRERPPARLVRALLSLPADRPSQLCPNFDEQLRKLGAVRRFSAETPDGAIVRRLSLPVLSRDGRDALYFQAVDKQGSPQSGAGAYRRQLIRPGVWGQSAVIPLS